MRITRQQSIEKTIKHWEWLAKTGKSKYDYPLLDFGKRYFGIANGCFLCEYSITDGAVDCRKCPLPGDGVCRCDAAGYEEWSLTSDVESSKAAAKVFLKVLYALRSGPANLGTCCHCNNKAEVYLTDENSILKFCLSCVKWATKHGYKEIANKEAKE